ncbi:MAG: hypothetical protein ABI646_01545 [Acidobacteriota bacterium]
MREITVSEGRVSSFNQRSSASRGFWTALLFPSIVGALVFLLTGLGISALSALHLITASRYMAYSAVGLLFGAFVLMFLAAHCMDRRDAAERSERIERSRQRGYTEKG